MVAIFLAKVGPVLGSATHRERVWSRSNFSWGTFRCKRPNATLAASSGFDPPSMIAWASSRILERGARLGRGCRPSARNSVGNSQPLRRALHSKPWRVHCIQRPLRCTFSSAVKPKQKFRLYGFPSTYYYGLLCGPIESSSTEVCTLNFLLQRYRPLSASRWLGTACCATACSGWRGHGRGPDFEDERDIRGNDQ